MSWSAFEVFKGSIHILRHWSFFKFTQASRICRVSIKLCFAEILQALLVKNSHQSHQPKPESADCRNYLVPFCFFKIIKRANSSPYNKVLIDNAHIKAFLQNRITIKMGFWSEHLTNHSSIFNRLSHMRLQKIEKSVKFPPFGISFLHVWWNFQYKIILFVDFQFIFQYDFPLSWASFMFHRKYLGITFLWAKIRLNYFTIHILQ